MTKGVVFNCIVNNADTIEFQMIHVDGGILYVKSRNGEEITETELNMTQIENLRDFLNEVLVK